MLNSISLIMHNPTLIGGLLLSILIGGISFLSAIELCQIKGLGVTTLKYVLACISAEAITNFFIIVLYPMEFLVDDHIFHSINIVIGFILFWVLIYEAHWIFKHPKMKSLKIGLKENADNKRTTEGDRSFN